MSATAKPGITLAADETRRGAWRQLRRRVQGLAACWIASFGGPAGQIAVMHRIVVEERRWISEARFLHALNYCHLLPGPEAQQLAIYIGWLMHKTARRFGRRRSVCRAGRHRSHGAQLDLRHRGNVSFVTGQGFGLKLSIPVLPSLDIFAALLAMAAAIAIFRFKVGVIQTLLACSLAGVVLQLAFGVVP